MLSKFRYRFHHTSDALSHSLSGFRRGAAIVPENLAVIHLDPMDWDGLRALVETLSHSAEGLERLALTAGRLSRCIALFDNRARSRMEYGKIRVDINDLLHMLSNYVEGIMPHVKLQNKIEDLARAIGKEIELLTELGEGWVGLDEKAIKSRIDQVLEQYRAIKRLLGRFVLNETPTIWKATPEEAPPPDTRLDHLPHSPSAWYRPLSGDSIHRSGCEPNTRIEIVDEIRYWIRYNRDQGLYWLNGMAGTGKTTIAYSMCEHLESSGHPMASFFCAWQLPECRNVRLIIPSLSHQLSLLLGPFRSTIVMSEDVEVLNWSISEQFERLVATPLRRAGHTFLANPVIVIDGLEECDNHDEVDEIVRVLITNVPGLPIKVLVTGRPTLKMDFFVRELRSSCDLAELRLHELHWWNVQRDIKTYLQSQLESISPSVKDLEGLASQTGGLFKHATFYTHYLLSTDIPAKGVERMKRLLGDSLTRDRGGQTDFLYATILEAALDENASEGTKSADTMLVLHTVVCVSKALTASMLVGLLGLSPATSIKTLLETLGLVLQIVGSSGRVTVRHKSFLDYICDRNRSGKFYCNIEQHATLLAQKCFDPMKAPTPMCNISNLASSYLSDQDTPGVRERINDAIPDKLLHACRNWGTYIVSIGSSKKLQLDMVQEFLSTRLLLWMEILNLKRCMRDGAEQLQKIYIWLKETKCSGTVLPLLEDAQSFVAAFMLSPLSEYTPHIYVSALPLWPKDRPISQYYVPKIGNLVKLRDASVYQEPRGVYSTGFPTRCVVCSPRGGYIAVCVNDNIWILDTRVQQFVGQALTGHTGSVLSVAYSPDGAYIVSGSEDYTTRIWDSFTGQPVGRPLEGHTDSVLSVAYSPDGAHIASSSRDNTIRIWDASTGRPVGNPLGGHTGWVYSIAYSPDGVYIVSGSGDYTTRIWDLRTGQPVGNPLEGHTDSVLSVAYSPDGAHIASGSRDDTIRIWDTHTGQTIGKSLQGHTGSVESVAYSPNGAYIVSASSDRTIRIWDAFTRQQVGEPLKGHRNYVVSIAYSLNGAYIVSGSSDCTIRTWNELAQHPITPQFHSAQSSTSPVSNISNFPVTLNRLAVDQASLLSMMLEEDWTMHEDGWIVDSSGNRLVWVPCGIRARLAHPIQNFPPLIGGANLDFSNARFGEEWQRCFDKMQALELNPLDMEIV